MPAGAKSSGEAEPALLAAGTFVGGRYRVVRFIARGGMGEVYEAFDEELRVGVALKVATRTTGRSLERFRREVALARRVTHRNVCRLFEIGFHPTDGGEVPYCTMELLEGTTLAQRIASGPIAIGDARAIVQQLVSGLQAAHDVGVIHRDFKSSNILLVADGDGRERAVITDFGLARAEVSDVATSTLTNEQALLGTPAYMAPEQVESKPVTAATDLYALGVVMFELVTGELPFIAETAMATAVLRLKQAPPSARSRRSDVPAAWDRAIARCLEIEPANRFARALDVAAALDARGGGSSRLRWLALAGAIAVAATAGALAIAGRRGSASHGHELTAHAKPGSLHAIAVLDPRLDAGDPAPWRATAAGELLRAELRMPGTVMTLDGATSARFARLLAPRDGAPAPITRLATITPAQAVITGELHRDRLDVELVDVATGETRARDGEPVHGDDLAGAAAHLGERLRRGLAGRDVPLDADHAAKVLPPGEAARAYAEGLAKARAFDHQGAIASLSRATELAPDFGLAYLALHDELRAVRQTAKAAAAAARAFELAGGLRSDQRLRAEAIYRESRKEWKLANDLWSTLSTIDIDDLDVAAAVARTFGADHQSDRCYAVLEELRRRPRPIGDDPRIDTQEALCAREAGDFRRGLSAATRADVKAGLRGERHEQAIALAVEGEMLGYAGEYDRAISQLELSKQLSAEAGDREGVFEALRQLGYVRSEQGDDRAAEAVYREALAVARELGDRLAEGIIMNDLGQVLSTPEAAIAMYTDGLAIAREQQDDRLTTALLVSLGSKQDMLERTDDAIHTYREVIELAKTQHDDENLATAELDLGDSLDKIGRWQEALPLAEDARASFQRRGDEDGIGFALETLGRVHWRLGDLKAARDDFAASLALRTKLGEKRHVATAQHELARLELAEDNAAAAEPLLRAAVAQRRTGTDPSKTAGSLVLLGRALVALGHPDEALAAVDEAEHLYKPEPTQRQGVANANDMALVRALAAPDRAAEQLPIIRTAGKRAACPDCAADALLREAEIERAAGHTAHARTLLAEVQRRAHAAHAEDLVARATLLLSKP